MRIDGELRHIRANRALTTDRFHHVAGTYDGDSMRLYLDGVLMGSREFSGTVAQDGGGWVYLGGASDGIEGMIDELAFYDRALSSEEIVAIFDAGSMGKCPQ